MKRREFLTGGMVAGALASRSRAAEASVTVHAGELLAAIAPDFLGLGYEISSVSRAGLLSASNQVYVQLIRTLGARGMIRVGGNTADFARYSAAGAPVSSPMGTVVNDAVLRDLGGFLKATGWTLIWALNLGSGSESEAVEEARAVVAAAGPNLQAFEIGNEPDLFADTRHRKPGYSYDEWLSEYRRYKAVLRARVPGVPLAGPDAAFRTDWVIRFAADEGKDPALLTHHYYREGQNPSSTARKLLGADPKLQPQLDKLRAASQLAKIPYRICEVNSFSGGGRPGVSDTMASALWVLDYLFTLAASGCAGVNMETGVNQLGFISSYSPIGDDERGHYTAKPEFYGILAFSLAGRGTLLKTQIDAGTADIKAYATRQGEGRICLTLINKGSAAAVLNVTVNGSTRGGAASVLRLQGPTLDAKSGITLAGDEVAANGIWKPAGPESVPVRNNRCRLEMIPASAAVVRLI
jgi:hypothetical protein